MEFHIPSYRFAGPGTKLAKRLKRSDKPKNTLDRIAMDHDIAYSKAKNLQDKWKADDVMIKAIDRLPRKKTMTEKVVKKIMQAKRKTQIIISFSFTSINAVKLNQLPLFDPNPYPEKTHRELPRT